MEKIKLQNEELEILNINQRGNLLEITFPQITNLTGKDLTTIELFTVGGINCALLSGYSTIYKVDGNEVTLSNDGAIYTEPNIIPHEELPIEPIIDVDAELAADITAATTLEELKNALLGKNGIAKVKGRAK